MLPDSVPILSHPSNLFLFLSVTQNYVYLSILQSNTFFIEKFFFFFYTIKKNS